MLSGAATVAATQSEGNSEAVADSARGGRTAAARGNQSRGRASVSIGGLWIGRRAETVQSSLARSPHCSTGSAECRLYGKFIIFAGIDNINIIFYVSKK